MQDRRRQEPQGRLRLEFRRRGSLRPAARQPSRAHRCQAAFDQGQIAARPQGRRAVSRDRARAEHGGLQGPTRHHARWLPAHPHRPGLERNRRASRTAGDACPIMAPRPASKGSSDAETWSTPITARRSRPPDPAVPRPWTAKNGSKPQAGMGRGTEQIIAGRSLLEIRPNIISFMQLGRTITNVVAGVRARPPELLSDPRYNSVAGVVRRRGSLPCRLAQWRVNNRLGVE